ncbi:sporulation protein [Kitasatospora sp. NPDC051914]|uniref:sporulation protein n=1 Tax=Kitasatospora sp. NPDC051914 TaxID=3154945 RepID=UPI00343BC62E
MVDCYPDHQWFEVAPGAERRVGFRVRLPWECPITELGDRSTGANLSLITTLNTDGHSEVRDTDFLHVAAAPLHEAVLDAFLAEGYRCTDVEVHGETVPHAEQSRNFVQTWFLEDTTRGVTALAQVEATILNSQVGALVFVRRADRGRITWYDKPAALFFPVAHHELGDADLGARLRAALADLQTVDRLAG